MSDSKSAPRQSEEIFGSFFLGESEFALAVSFLQEVVNAPPTYTLVPLAPKYLKGLFNLRGTVVPVLDLRTHLQIGGSHVTPDNQKIAVIDLGGACVGLLFDKTGEIFRSIEDERSDFHTGQDSAIVSGVFKKDNGQRIVQIINVKNVFNLQSIPKDANRNRLGRDFSGKKRGNRKQCISFLVGPSKCALPISDIQEILKVEKLNESALGVGNCIGTIDLRGLTVPVIDFTSLLNYREIDRTKLAIQGDRRVIVMRLDKELFGLLVDAVDSIVSYFIDDLISFLLVEQSRSEMFLGCISTQGNGDILLLDHQKILNDSEVNEITRGHSKIYQNNSSTKKDLESQKGTRRTYITFTIDGTYAIPIAEVKEIIEYPKVMLQPPGLKKHVRGVLNLRGELVTIVDARNMYSETFTQESTRKDTQKVLVFKKENTHFGLIVDSVESIITFNDADKVKLPELLYHKGEGSMSSDISEAVEITDAHGNKISMLIISADSISSRATKSLAA